MLAHLLKIIHKYSDPLQWDSKLSSGASCFHWSSLRCFYNLESSCGKSNWLDMIWKGPTVDSACQSKIQAMRLKELSVDLRDRIVSRHRSGEWYQKMSAALKVPSIEGPQHWRSPALKVSSIEGLQHWRSPRTQWPQSFFNGSSCEPPILFLELATQPNWAIRGEGLWSRWSPSQAITTILLWINRGVSFSQSFSYHTRVLQSKKCK
jgi:hypothetical protein